MGALLDEFRASRGQGQVSQGEQENVQPEAMEQPASSSSPDQAQSLLEEFRASRGSSGNSSDGQVGSFGQRLVQITDEKNNNSPLSFIERVSLSFADDSGKERILKDKFQIVERLPNGKFAAGNSPDSMAPVDPEGIFNDMLGDLADVTSLIPSIAGQIVGGTLGIPAGPGGVVAGGAVGSGVGEAISKAIGKGMGVNDQTAKEAATDIVIATTFGAAGEAIGQSLKLAKPVLINRIGKIMDAGAAKKSANPQALKAYHDITAKTFRIIANVDEEATRDALKHGALNTFTKENLDPQRILKIADDFVETVAVKRRALGQRVGAVKGELIGKTGNRAVVPVRDTAGRMIKDLQDAGIVTQQGFFKNTRDIQGFSASEISSFKKVLRGLGVTGADSKTDILESLGKNIKVSDALQFKNSIASTAVQFGKRAGAGNANPRTEVILNRVLTGNLDNPAEKGISNYLTEIAERVGAKNFAAANKEFAEFAVLTKSLKRQGLDLDNLGAVENFAKRFEKKTEFLSSQFEELNRRLPKDFIPDIEKFNAAQAFKSTSPDILRFGAVAATVGSLTGFETPKDRAFTIGGALLLGTPRGLQFLLKSGAKTSQAMASKSFKLPKAKINEKHALALISQLSRAKESNNGKPSNENQNSGNMKPLADR